MRDENKINHDRNRNKCPRIKCNIFEEQFDALVDTGAEISIISNELFDNIARENKVPQLPVVGVTIIGATGKKSKPVNRQCFLPIKFNDNKIRDICFLIVYDIKIKLILGADFLSEFGATISYNLRNITLKDTESNNPIEFYFENENNEYESYSVSINNRENYKTNDNINIKVSAANVQLRHKIGSELKEKAKLNKISEPNKTDLINYVNDIKMLTKIQRNRLFTMLIKNKDVFSDNPGRVIGYEHVIKVNDQTPYHKYQYTTPLAQEKDMDKAIENLLKDKIIEKTTSQFINPILPIKKGDQIRPVLDARFLNKRIIPEYERPIPTDELLSKYQGAKYLSTTDLSAAFFQIPLSNDSKQYTAFMYKGQIYQYTVLPYGLCNSVASFMRCINAVLGPEILSNTIPYIDDLITGSKTFDEHIDHLDKLYTKLLKYNLKIKFSKTLICREEIPCLGHILTTEGVKVDPEKIKTIRAFLRPKNVKGLQSFLGLCNYLHKFNPSYAQTVSPLYELLKKGNKFKWNEIHENAFIKVKELFISTVMLHHPTPHKTFYIECDASHLGLGSLVYQYDDDNNKKIIYCASRSLKPAEKNYCISELELLAILYSLDKFHYLIAGSPIIVRTDHKALTFLNKCRLLSGRLSRWILSIQNYNIQIEYIEGKNNISADFLSRNPINNDEKFKKLNNEEIVIAKVNKIKELDGLNELKNLNIHQRDDNELNKIIKTIEAGGDDKKTLGGDTENNKQKLLNNYLIHENILFKKCPRTLIYKICIPYKFQKELTIRLHENLGHFGAYKLFCYINKFFIWKYQRRTIKKYVSSCDICQKTKYSNNNIRNKIIPIIPNKPKEIISIDLFGPLPRAKLGLTYILVVLDVFTKFIVLYPIRRATTNIILNKLVNDYFIKVGKPEYILSDNGSQFRSKLWASKLKEEGVLIKYTTPYHPQSNPVERQMKEIGRILRAYLNNKQTVWPEVIPKINIWLNIMTHYSTGFSPYELQFNQPVQSEINKIIKFPNPEVKRENFKEIILKTKNNLSKAANNRVKSYKTRNETIFEEGDLVLIKNHKLSSSVNKEMSKLFHLYIGPYKINKKLNDNTYQIIDEDGKDLGKHNIYNLKKYNSAKE